MARILVIDDDEPLLTTLEQLLTASGHVVVAASDGAIAAKLYGAEPFEVVGDAPFHVLATAGYVVHRANDGEEAWSKQ